MSVTAIQSESATRMSHLGKTLHTTKEYDADPKKAIIDFVTPFLDKVSIGPAKILVATYRQNEKTAGGIYKTAGFIEEDKFQGVAGLILKCGPLAFSDDGRVKFGGFQPAVFDWVTYNPEYGRAREFRGLHCRIIEDIYIDSIIQDAELFW